MGNICHMCPTGPIVDLALSNEENSFVNSELSLAFSRHPVPKLAQTLRANSTNQKLTDNQFNTVVTELRLNVADLDSVGSPIFNFYKSFKTKGSYDLTKLLVLAAMLGAGSTAERVTVLFELLPGIEEGMATSTSLDWLVDQVFTISAKNLPLLAASEEPVRGVSLSAEELEAYMARLASNLALAKPAATRLILKERKRVSSQDLQSALDGWGPLGKVLRPLEARRFILLDEHSPK
jgi:hypothetical protein